MTRIRLYDHPFAAVEPKRFEAESLAHWMLAHYGEVPTVKVQVFKGEPCAENEITHDLRAMLANDADGYVVLQSPAGTEWLIYAAIIAVVVAVASVLLAPKPVLPGNINRTQQSPNNDLGTRENKVRLLERVEDIYGTVKSIPSLMMPTYNKYINNEKYEYGYYCVGRGYYELADLRDGDTLVADIDGASAAVYDPFTSPNSGDPPALQIGAAIIDPILTVSRAVEVDGVTLNALNQVALPATALYHYTPDVGGDIITQVYKQPNINKVAVVSASVVVTMADQPFSRSDVTGVIVDSATHSYTDYGAVGWLFAFVQVGQPVTFSGFADAGNNGTFTVATKPNANVITVSTGSQVSGYFTGVSAQANLNYSGTYSIASVADGSITLATSTFVQPLVSVSSSVATGITSNYTDWITLPDLDRSEVWANVTATNGLYKDSGGKSPATVAFEMQIEQLDAVTLAPLGTVETVTGSLTGASGDEQADTTERATAWAGPARVRLRRTTDFDYAFPGTVQDEIKWADLYSVSPVVKTEFGNKTTIHTITQATSRATAVKSRQLNCIASRMLPTYNGTIFSGAFDSAGMLASGTIAATSKIVDIIAAVSEDPKIGRRDLATEVDMPQIWAVQQALDAWNVECGQFNFTFDTDNASFEETVINIANAGFCIAYRQNGKIRLALDRAQASSTALFTHRNKKPNAETITRKFASDAEYDGVEFVYSDPDTGQSETITLPLSGSYTKLKKFEIAGIRSFTQAWFRANREYAKLIGQRLTIETGTTLDARALLPNARIDIVDNTRFKSYDGEVVGQSGFELTLSRDVAFVPATAHSIVLMRRDGTLQSITCTAGSAANKIVLQSLPSEAIVTTYGENGIRTIFSFAADSARGAMAWLVQEVDLSDGQYATLRAINYSDAYYTADAAAVPPKASVIN